MSHHSLHHQTPCVIGGQGRIGRRLVRELLTRGAKRVVVLGHSSSRSDLAKSKKVSVSTVNILNAAQLKKKLAGCTMVFHLAALTRVDDSENSPMPYLQTNGWGVALLADVCRELKIRRIIYTSSALVYGRPQRLPVKETQPTKPISVYAASKLLGEATLQGYAINYGFSCDIARLSNVYGNWIDKTTVMGSALAQALSGQGVIALKNWGNVRDFIHVDDVVEALLRLATSGHTPGCRVMNVSSGRGVSIRELAQTVSHIAQSKGMGKLTLKRAPNKGRNPITKLVLDNSLLRAKTGWKPRVTLKEGLRQALTEFQS